MGMDGLSQSLRRGNHVPGAIGRRRHEGAHEFHSRSRRIDTSEALSAVRRDAAPAPRRVGLSASEATSYVTGHKA
jgi:hypothetical protein